MVIKFYEMAAPRIRMLKLQRAKLESREDEIQNERHSLSREERDVQMQILKIDQQIAEIEKTTPP